MLVDETKQKLSENIFNQFFSQGNERKEKKRGPTLIYE
jgi:hypothetical protein